MKEENHKKGSSWAPIDVSPPADSLVGFRCLSLNPLYKWSINQCLTASRFHHRIELFDNAPYMAQGKLDKPRKAIMNQWTRREAEIERDIGSTVGIYGTQNAIAGNSPHKIDELSLKAHSAFTKTLFFFMRIFIVSNRDRTSYFANNNARNFTKHHLALPA